MKTLISITTFKKNEALDACLRGLVDNKYTNNNRVIICDDNAGEAIPIYEKYKPEIKELSISFGKKRGGIFRNKNRGIHYFLEKYKDCDSIFMSDDDISYIAPGLLQRLEGACRDEKLGHMTTFIDGAFDKEPEGFFKLFPPVGSSDKVLWCRGVQGVGIYIKRELLTKVGYMQKFSYEYGAEHSELSTRMNRVEGTTPEVFPLYKNSHKFMVTQQIPNNYDVDLDRVYKENIVQYNDFVKKTVRGTMLHNDKNWLNMKEEQLIENASN